MAQVIRAGEIRARDTKITIWEDPVRVDSDYDKDFKTTVFRRVVQQLKRLGWSLIVPKDMVKDYGLSFARHHRIGQKGILQLSLGISGRCIEIEVWQSLYNVERNDLDGQYEFNKYERMPYFWKKQFEVTKNRLIRYLCNVFTHYHYCPDEKKLGPGGLTAIEKSICTMKATGHYVPSLGRAEISMRSNETSRDKLKIIHKNFVYFCDSKGRIFYGQAFYDLNATWLIVTGKFSLYYVQASNIFVNSPGDLRLKRNKELRRDVLERKMKKAVESLQFKRAQQIKDILFGPNPLFRLRSGSSYWRPRFAGYTASESEAGCYTEVEIANYRNREDVKIIPIYADKI